MTYAEIAVDAPAGQGDTFTYSVPAGLRLRPGQLVEVPFGPRQAPGFVFTLSKTTAYPGELRQVTRVIDERPWLSDVQIALAKWVSTYYRSPAYAAAALVVPPDLRQRVTTIYSPVPQPTLEQVRGIKEPAAKLLGHLASSGPSAQGALEKRFGKRLAASALRILVSRNLVQRSWLFAKPKVGPKLAPVVFLAVSLPNALAEVSRLESTGKPAEAKQALLLLDIALSGEEGAFESSLRRSHTAVTTTLASLERRGLVQRSRTRVMRDPLANISPAKSAPLTLTAEQQAAWSAVEAAIAAKPSARKPLLLFGVTGSGKTELYIRALERVVRQGKRGIVLVPEIALTPQIVERFAERFLGRVAVLHSGLTPGERFDEWWRIHESEASVVIGSRSAIFAPQPDLGLIVLDEEHEWTYKQEENQPLYHARDVALKLAELTGATVILGSATPSLESYHCALTDRYQLLELKERIGASLETGKSGTLAQVSIVDMREELKGGNSSIFSNALRSEMHRALAAGEQVILFLNRRGAATFVQCRDCGYVARCRRCDSPLTYHSDAADLECHRCGYHVRAPSLCPECGGRRIRYMGLGTQRLEEETAQAFPAARLLRWDRDVTQARGSHEAILRRFIAHQADVLIGTQMLAKGLHIPSVTLVGVVNADIGLHSPDFRAAERVFQVLTQVAGRSGRGERPGRVIFQTYSPDNYAILAAATQDYPAFFADEVRRRMELGLPPLTRIARLLFQHTNRQAAQEEAEKTANHLSVTADTLGLPGTKVIGPAPAPYERLRGRYRWQVLVQGLDPNALLDAVKLSKEWLVDIDPQHMM